MDNSQPVSGLSHKPLHSNELRRDGPARRHKSFDGNDLGQYQKLSINFKE